MKTPVVTVSRMGAAAVVVVGVAGGAAGLGAFYDVTWVVALALTVALAALCVTLSSILHLLGNLLRASSEERDSLVSLAEAASHLAELGGELQADITSAESRVYKHSLKCGRVVDECQNHVLGELEEVTKRLEANDQSTREVVESIRALEARYSDDRRQLTSLLTNKRRLRHISQVSMQWLKTEIVREVEALHQLRRLLNVSEVTPLLGGWAMDAVAVLGLVREILERRPSLIVELGSGASTVWMALALRKLGGRGKVVSFEHLEEYAERTREALLRLRLESFAEVRVAPIAPVQYAGRSYRWYNIPDPEMIGTIDLLLVDGPPGNVCRMARMLAVPTFVGQLSSDALVILDDAFRPDEIDVKNLWKQAYPDLIDGFMLGERTQVFILRGNSAFP